MIAADTDWVEDVRRWYFNGGRPAGQAPAAPQPNANAMTFSTDGADVGYEAAEPAIQSRNWLATSSGELGDCR